MSARRSMFLAAIVLALALIVERADASDTAPVDDQEILARSLVSAGDSSRLRAGMLKARRGEPITVAVIGGSITAGSGASAVENRYGSLVAQWWRSRFPDTTVTLLNAGVGATATDYAALRARRDLLSKDPDLVIIEFGINDGAHQWVIAPMEGLVRQILRHDESTAAMMLFTMRKDGTTAQEWHAKVGLHYGLPMVSYRNAFWPELQSGKLAWEDISADIAHPNDRGHAYCASFINSVLDDVFLNLPARDEFPKVQPIPAPLQTDVFEKVTLVEAGALSPVFNQGWSYNRDLDAWTADVPGSTVEFETQGHVVSTVHHAVPGAMGKARVSLDETPLYVLDGWFAYNWAKFHVVTSLPWQTDPGTHRLRFVLLDEKDPQSTGHQFRIKEIGMVGRPMRDCGDPIDDDVLRSGDALRMLHYAVGFDVECPAWLCDTDSDGQIGVTDSLLTLNASVGNPVGLVCAEPAGLMIRLISPEPLNRLRVRIDYASTGGTLAVTNGELHCFGMNEAFGHSFRSIDAQTLELAMLSRKGATAGGSLAYCAFDPAGAITPADVTINVLEAVDADGRSIWNARFQALPW